jgi:RecA/RadA recombinase
MPGTDEEGADSAVQAILAGIKKELGDKAVSEALLRNGPERRPHRVGPVWFRNLVGDDLRRGDLIELRGGPGTDPDRTAMQMAAEVTKRGGFVVWLSALGEFDNAYADSVGLDRTKVIPLDGWDDPEIAFRALTYAVTHHNIELAVVDSIATIVTPAERRAGIGSKSNALAQFVTRVMRVLPKLCRLRLTTLVLCSQSRHITFGSSDTSVSVGVGGAAMKDAVRIVIDLSTKLAEQPDPHITARRYTLDDTLAVTFTRRMKKSDLTVDPSRTTAATTEPAPVAPSLNGQNHPRGGQQALTDVH